MHSLQFSDTARELAAIGRRFYARGWVMGTSGNLSAVLTRRPLTLAITASAVHKGFLSEEQILLVDERGMPDSAAHLAPSAECLLHIGIVGQRDCGAVLHTHSIWSTILSEHFAPRGGVEIEGYEMLKGLAGITSHQVTEFVPILENDQDMGSLSARLAGILTEHPRAHAVLLRRHGVYTWGSTLAEAERHMEVLEFLFEAVGRSLSLRTLGEATYGALENT